MIKRIALVLVVAVTTCFMGVGAAQAASLLPASAPVAAVSAAPQATLAVAAPAGVSAPEVASAASLASVRGDTCFPGIFCLYFTHLEQLTLLAGGSGALAAAACAETGIGCIVAGGLVAAAVTFLSNQPLCPGELEVPVRPGGVPGCV